MNKKIYSIGLLVALMFLLGWSWGCSQKTGKGDEVKDVGITEEEPTETPQIALKQFAKALKQNNSAAVLQLVTFGAQLRWQRILKILPAEGWKTLAEAVESAEIVEQEPFAAKAKVKTKIPGASGGDDFIYLRLENDVWKISAL